MTAVTIVDCNAQALDDIMPVMRSAFDPAYGEAWTASQCAGILSLPGSWLIAARTDNHIAGFALARAILDEAELLLLAVDTRYQRRKIGFALLDRMILDSASKGVSKLFLEVRANNPAHSFYERNGFSAVGLRRNYYRGAHGQLTDAVTLSRIIG
jgi:[ribosomal protein S18]-alanine N-acetyltransferase